MTRLRRYWSFHTVCHEQGYRRTKLQNRLKLPILDPLRRRVLFNQRADFILVELRPRHRLGVLTARTGELSGKPLLKIIPVERFDPDGSPRNRALEKQSVLVPFLGGP